MTQRISRGVVEFSSRPAITGQAAVGGHIECQGPLGRKFAECFQDQDNEPWEVAETRLQRSAIRHALASAGCAAQDIDLHLGGDLLNQCTATSFALREEKIPMVGVYAACSSFALAMALAAMGLDGGGLQRASVCASSHFCAAEKQFRFPLEMGVQLAPAAQRTATAAGAAVLTGGFKGTLPRVTRAVFGRVVDYGIKTACEMGAAMAPAAWDTLRRFLADTKTQPSDYDCILTGDLGEIGSQLFQELAQTEGGLNLSGVHRDGGTTLFDTKAQDVGAGGSGIGCSAAVLCAEILPKLQEGSLQRVLFIGTGALLSAISPLQGESIPAIAHGVLIERK